MPVNPRITNESVLMKNLVLIIVAAFWLVACGSEPETKQASEASEAEIRAALSELGRISSVQASEWDGVYEVVINGQMLYVSADGSHFIAGDLYRSEGRVNLTDLQRDDLRKQVLDSLEPEDAIVFAPEAKPEHVVWVFTDVDCAYCQRLHQDIAQYNSLGIEVRYVAFPRAGEGSQSWTLSESVWCADDRKAALTHAKQGAEVGASPSCSDNSVAHGYAAGKAVGLRGTPMILDAQGRQLGGYLTPPEMLQRLQSNG